MTRPLNRTRQQQITAAIRQLCDIIDHRYQPWAQHTTHELATCDGFGARGGDQTGRRSSSDKDGEAPLTALEKAVLTREAIERFTVYVNTSLDASAKTLLDIVTSMEYSMGLRAPAPPEAFCTTGTGREGAELPWTPNSTDARNGWADPTCRNLAAAGRGQLCEACSKREDRWRRRQGLPPRSHVIPTGEVA